MEEDGEQWRALNNSDYQATNGIVVPHKRRRRKPFPSPQLRKKSNNRCNMNQVFSARATGRR